MTLPLSTAFAAILISGVIVYALRAFPFVLFSKKDPPEFIRFIEHYIPPMVMAVLLVYCLKNVEFLKKPFGIPEAAGLLFTVGIHLWKRNPMISIFGGTILYMVLSRVM